MCGSHLEEMDKVAGDGEGGWRWRRWLEMEKMAGDGEGGWRWRRWLELEKVAGDREGIAGVS